MAHALMSTASFVPPAVCFPHRSSKLNGTQQVTSRIRRRCLDHGRWRANAHDDQVPSALATQQSALLVTCTVAADSNIHIQEIVLEWCTHAHTHTHARARACLHAHRCCMRACMCPIVSSMHMPSLKRARARVCVGCRL